MVDVQWTERTTTDRIFSWIIQSIQRRKSSGTTDRHRTTTTIEWKTDGSCSRWTKWRPTLGQSTRIRTRLGSTTTTNLHLDSAEIARMNQKTRNRIANRRRRGKRYRSEVIRQIYPSFTITKLKRILKSINISPTSTSTSYVKHCTSAWRTRNLLTRRRSYYTSVFSPNNTIDVCTWRLMDKRTTNRSDRADN